MSKSELTDDDKTYQNACDMQVVNELYTIYLSHKTTFYVRYCLCALISLICVSNVVGEDKRNESVNIAVASNFLMPLKYLSPVFEQKTNVKVKIIAASTAKLYAQILNGAPYDVFLSADMQTAINLQNKRKTIIPDDLFRYATGQLVLWSVLPVYESVTTLKQHFMQVSFKRLAMANPKTAPYGRAASQVLQYFKIKLGRSQQILGESVGQAFQFTGSGNVDMGFVAYSQIIGRDIGGQVWLVPEQAYQPIAQYGLLLRKKKQNLASVKFMVFLTSPEIQALLKQKFGYL